MSSILKTFKVAARVGWWYLYLRTSLSGAGLTAVSALSVEQQNNYEEVKQTLLSTYLVYTETYRRKVFELSIDQNNGDGWLRTYRQCYSQWLNSMDKNRIRRSIDGTHHLQVSQMAGDLHEEPQPWQFRRAQGSHSQGPGKSEMRWHLN